PARGGPIVGLKHDAGVDAEPIEKARIVVIGSGDEADDPRAIDAGRTERPRAHAPDLEVTPDRLLVRARIVADDQAPHLRFRPFGHDELDPPFVAELAQLPDRRDGRRLMSKP